MSNIFHFTPLVKLKAEENLNHFIAKCRDELTVFGSDLDWNKFVWPKVAVFSKLGVTTRKPEDDQLMDLQFSEFAKAYFRYQQGHKPTGAKNELKALKAVEAALIKETGRASISNLSTHCLNTAVELAKEHYEGGAAYQCGREIERLSKFVSENGLISSYLSNWKNPIKRPSDTVKTGAQAKVMRESKLPDEIALQALAEIFANNPSDDRDIFTTSIFAMTMSAPSRITEILALPLDCEVYEKDRDGVERYGWRFYSGKGFEGDIKWIPSVMVEIAKEAVSRVKKLSENARKLALWIEEQPDKFYRHPNCPQVSETQSLTMVQACCALGLANDTPKACRTSLVNRKLEAQDGVHTLASLWKHTKERLPKEFPWFDKEKGIKFSNALFALNLYQFNSSRSTCPVEVHKPTNNFFNNDLSPREALGNDSNHQSIFDRYGYLGDDGQRLKVTSKQARHFLNTVAQRGGLSNLEIAKWSGRADVKQNRVYNHMTEAELVAMAERIDPSKGLFGPAGEVEKHLPATTQEFNTLETAAVHVTEFGFCVHDYTMSPCDKFRDCLNCTEQVCVKGDTHKLERLKGRLEKEETILSNAGISISDISVEDIEIEENAWIASHKKTVLRTRRLIEILEDPDTEDGAQIKLSGNDFTQLRRVVSNKAEMAIGSSNTLPELEQEASKKDNKNKDEQAMLADLSAMLGGGFG